MDENNREKMFEALKSIVDVCLRTEKCHKPCKCPFYDVCKHGLDMSPYLWHVNEEEKEVIM